MTNIAINSKSVKRYVCNHFPYTFSTPERREKQKNSSTLSLREHRTLANYQRLWLNFSSMSLFNLCTKLVQFTRLIHFELLRIAILHKMFISKFRFDIWSSYEIFYGTISRKSIISTLCWIDRTFGTTVII